MRKPAFLFITCIIITVLMSCKGDPGPADNIFCAQFQQGILPSTGYTGSEDTFIAESQPNSTNATCSSLTVGGVGGKKYRSLISFTLNTIPAAAIVEDAFLTLTISQIPGNVTLTAYTIPESWFMGGAGCSVLGISSYDATWTAPWTTPGGAMATQASGPVNVRGGEVRQATFTLDNSMLQNWIKLGYAADPASNHGVMIVSNTETGTDYMAFYSGDVTNLPEYRPVLSIYYRLP